MLELAKDPALADKQMRAVIFYLTTFGHIDGEFDLSRPLADCLEWQRHALSRRQFDSGLHSRHVACEEVERALIDVQSGDGGLRLA